MINTHLGIVKNGAIIWDAPEIRQHQIKSLEGVGITETLKKRYKAISNPQYRYLYGTVYALAGEWFLEKWGEKFTDDQVDIFFKNIYWFKEIHGHKIPVTKTKMDTKEGMDYIRNVVEWMALNMGVYVPEPKGKLCQKQQQQSALKV